MVAAHYYVFVRFVNRNSLFLARVSVFTAAGNPAWFLMMPQSSERPILKDRCSAAAMGNFLRERRGRAVRGGIRAQHASGHEKRLQHFSLLVHTEQPLPTWLFLKKSRTSLNLTVQSRSENALAERHVFDSYFVRL
jgi:hypothetical protein